MNAWDRSGMGLSSLMSPTQYQKAVREARFRKWRDRSGGDFAEDFFVYEINVGNLNAGASAQVVLQIENDSAFEWEYTSAGSLQTASSSNPITVQIADAGSSRNLFNQALPMQLFSGSGQLPHVLPVTRRFLANSSVQFTFNNFDTAVNLTNVTLNLIGRKIFGLDSYSTAFMQSQEFQFNSWKGYDGRQYCEDYFGYAVNVGTMAAAAVQSITTLIQSDADFEWIATETAGYRNVTTGAYLQQPVFTWNIKDGSANRYLMAAQPGAATQQAFVPVTTGVGNLPFILPSPRMFTARTPFTLDLTNIDAVTWNSVFFLLEGRKIFRLH